jgi:hypothetical protein
VPHRYSIGLAVQEEVLVRPQQEVMDALVLPTERGWCSI